MNATLHLLWKLLLLVLGAILVGGRLVLGLSRRRSPVWLIGENRGDAVSDNGVYFFRYCRQQHPEMRVFFALNACSSLYRELARADANIVAYGSLRHIYIFSIATVFFYTHTWSDVMYGRIVETLRAKRSLVFLHHGVLGFKRFDEFYQAHRNVMDIFTVGNHLEKTILEEIVGVRKGVIRVTGYARYDYLADDAETRCPSLVYMPTFRDWIYDHDTFTPFADTVNRFLNHPELQTLLNGCDATLYVYLHKYMQSFAGALINRSQRVRIVMLDTDTPTRLISRCSLMITDYSSPAWDFFFLGKPVVFWRFDVEKYLAARGSYFPLHDENIGPVVFDQDSLVREVQRIAGNGFTLDDRFSTYRRRVFPELDRANCSRIYQEVVQLPGAPRV